MTADDMNPSVEGATPGASVQAHPSPQHFDVLIVGAGISGIGTACHLQVRCPEKSYVILEGRHDFGGTWDLFRYPGIRSDSDMHTLGYEFKPWKAAKAIADGPAIKEYLEETIEEWDLARHIRYHHHVHSASWSSEDGLWTVRASNKQSGEAQLFTCNFLSICSGYYSYKKGYTPEFREVDQYEGTLVHPQKWPEDLDYKDKRVLVIGSGATAMTIVPAMAPDAAHVTMLQRSPTYVVSRPDEDFIANALRKILPSKLAYAITRWKNITMQNFFYKQTRTKPKKVREKLLKLVRKGLRDDYDVDTHFTPKYDPWDQRLCLIPNSDLYEAINSGKASVTTAQMDRFTPKGVRLSTGEEIEADIIVTATGLNLVVLGEIQFDLDGEVIDFAQTWSYKGLMYSGVPNMMSTFGYINASWTLRADLTAGYLCRLFEHMKVSGTSVCTPQLRPEDVDMPALPWIQDFSSGYMARSMHLFPKQGDRDPWTNPQDYARERKVLRKGPIDDAMVFTSPGATLVEPEASEELSVAS